MKDKAEKKIYESPKIEVTQFDEKVHTNSASANVNVESWWD